MFPLKDDIPSRHFPLVTLGIIALNVVVFLHEVRLGPDLDHFLLEWGLVPVRYTNSRISSLFSLREQAAPFVTSMFLHGGWMHLLGNMWTLWIFGDNVEDRLGRARYALLYLFGGLAAAVLHLLANAGSSMPTIGASGAVAAVMGAYFRMYPRANVAMIVPPFFWGPVFVVPAVVFLGWWLVLQFFNGTLSLLADPSRAGGVAWWAHVGGFAFGLVCASAIRTRSLRSSL
ncbi:MAG TPA: rhomboid family intramembrane serine protease [Candidatus Binatia bacterium]|nr:rhomboid family intramembrane serine protease [Candidatus Binatia bacterium]